MKQLIVWGLALALAWPGMARGQETEYREILPPGPRNDWSDRTEPEEWAPPAVAPGRIDLNEALVIDGVGLGGRYPLHTDAIEKQIVLGQWRSPATGDEVVAPDGRTRAWRQAEADADGWFHDPALRSGYADFVVLSDSDRVMMLDAAGHSLAYVNGVIRTGDPYGVGNMKTPVKLKKGLNELLFRCRRGRLRAALYPPEAAVTLDAQEVTVPDLVHGETAIYHAAVLIVNASEEVLQGAVLLCDPEPDKTPPEVARLFSRTITAVPAIPPLSVYKAPFTLRPRSVPKVDGMEARLSLARSAEALGDLLSTATISLTFRTPLDTRRETFLSDIDCSVQRYAVTPARPAPGDPRQAALVLTAHGAGVDAFDHVNAYTQKSWAHIVGPSNRRAYGFDWEDWGRLDAMEALDVAARRLNADSRRYYLTGHSMGGHGA